MLTTRIAEPLPLGSVRRGPDPHPRRPASAPSRQESPRSLTCGAAALALCFVTALPAPAAGSEAERGRALALRWCTGCHVVDPDAPGGDTGPAFQTLRAERTEPALRSWLFEPHPPMPDLNLTAGEIDAILAYIRSLGDPGR